MGGPKVDVAKITMIKSLYDKVLQTANEFLHNANHFPLEFLQDEDPTYESVAETIDMVCKVITVLCEDVDDPLTGQKAYEYCAYMKGMALAIKDGDEARLAEIAAELNRRSFL